MVTKNDQQLSEVQQKLDRVCNGIDVMQNKQEEMSQDIAKIKEAVYNPDQGIYARLRELEAWKETNTKAMWIVFATVIGMACTQAWEFFGAGT